MYTELIDVAKSYDDFYTMIPKSVFEFQDTLYDILIPALMTVSQSYEVDDQALSNLKDRYEVFSKRADLKKIKENNTNEFTNVMGQIDIGLELWCISNLETELTKLKTCWPTLQVSINLVIDSYMKNQKRINDFQRAWISSHQK
ncbi:MAG: hypothetical protein ACFNZT_08715 [Streptococcus mutans]